jgi:hypothetical protein
VRRDVRPHRGVPEDYVVCGITAEAWQQWIEDNDVAPPARRG